MRSRSLRRRFNRVMSLMLVALLTVPWSALASLVDIAVVDIVAPVDSVELAAGGSAPIVIRATITGAQAAESTFKVNTVWTLSGGTWSGSAPVRLVSPPRAAQDPPTVIEVSGVVKVASGQARGSHTAVVSAFDIVNSPGQGGKLADGDDGRYTVNVIQSDSIAPVITTPGNLVVEAAGASGAPATFAASAWDETDGALPVTCTPASGSTFPLGTTTVACSAVDAAGNVGTANFTVTVRDTTAPVLSLPAGIVAEATGPGGAAVGFAASASDLVDGPVSVSYSHQPDSTFALGTTEVRVNATDAAGNTASGSFTVTVRDTTAPVIDPLSDLSMEAAGPGGAIVTFSASASDIVDGGVGVVCVPPSGSTFPLGENEVVCTATDAAGNKATLTFKVTVSDTTEPMLTLPGNMTVEATGPDGAIVSYAPTAYDLVDGDVPVICVPTSGWTFGLGSHTVACTASDSRNNAASGSFSVDVVDTTPPAITVPNNITSEATGPDGATVDFSASALDIVDGPVSVSYSRAPGSTFALGTTEVRVSATDSRGNSASRAFKVTVVDTTAPVIEVPEDITAEATGPGGAAVDFAASASDLVDGPVSVSYSHQPGSTFPLGTTTVMCTAEDDAGNSTSATFLVTVKDSTPPAVTAPADMMLEATGPGGAQAVFSSAAVDIVDGALPVTCTPASGSTFPLGTTTVACSAVDAAGNVGTANFTVTVRDTTAPVLSLPAGIVAEATGPGGAAVGFAASASDLVDGPVSVSYSHQPDSTFALGTTEVRVNATDAAGNTASGSFTVTVRDTTAPVIDPLSDLSMEAAGPGGAIVTFSASASDIVDGGVGVVCVPPSGSTFPLGENEVVCTATDAAGNKATLTFKVTVSDTTEPMLTLPGNMTVEATGPDGAIVSYAPTAYDLVDGDVPVICVPTSGWTFGLGSHTVACTASDSRNNAASGSFSVDVVDTTPPAITVPNNITSEATGPDGATVDFSASALDIVDGPVSVSYSRAPGSTFALGTTEVRVSATDSRGNSASRAFKVTVVDTTAPVIGVPANLVLVATGASGARGNFEVRATDIVDGECAVTVSHPSGSTFPLGTTTVVGTAKDKVGNTSQASFTVTVTYAWSGFLQPINTNGSSVFKLGSTVPVKFRLNGASAAASDATARLYLTKVSNGVLGTEIEAVTSTPASTGNLFRYDAAEGLYIYNFGTKGMDAGTYELRVDLGDGVKDRTVRISLRK